jgi:hypothetical protein
MVKICIIHYHILCMRNKTWRNQRTNFSWINNRLDRIG